MEDDIKIFSSNIFGLKSYVILTFLDLIKQYHIVFLCETWVGKNGTCNPEIPGYRSEHSFGTI